MNYYNYVIKLGVTSPPLSQTVQNCERLANVIFCKHLCNNFFFFYDRKGMIKNQGINMPVKWVLL